MLANSEGTRRLLRLAQARGARFLFASTSEIYGDPLLHPQREEYRGNVSCIGPRANYDESKRYGEAMTMAFVRHFETDARIVRIFNTYGPRADLTDGRVIVNFVRQALRRESMTIYSDGLQTRSMCYVDDLVDGLMRAMEMPGTRGEVVNLGNPEEYSVQEIAELVRHLTDSDSRFVYTEPAVGDDPRVRCPDITKARALLGWSPSTPLETGLKLVMAEMLSLYNGELSSGLYPLPSWLPEAARARLNGHGEPATEAAPHVNGHANGSGGEAGAHANAAPAPEPRPQSSGDATAAPVPPRQAPAAN
jgi:dTDP-glucose 4,6-dehydratase/UDP-glucuronate decarboxylase